MTKKTLTLILGVCLVLLIKSDVMAELNGITLKGEAKFKYSWVNESSILDGFFTIYDKIDANTQFFLTTKYLNPDSLTNTSEIFVDSCFVIYEIKPIRSTITVGYFNYATGNLDLLANTISDIKSYSGLKFLMPINPKFYLKFGIIPDEQLIPNEPDIEEKSVYGIGFDYVGKVFGIGANYIYINPAENNTGYTLNSYFKPNEYYKFYLHYGSDENQDVERVLGCIVNLPVVPMSLCGEYNFDEEPPDANRMGYKITYKFNKNLSLYYSRVEKTSQINELVFHAIW